MLTNPHLYKRFYIEAKKAEIESLQHLADNCSLVNALKESIHQMQKERGMSNIYLGSNGIRYSEELSQQITRVDNSVIELEDLLAELYLKANNQHFNMPLLSKISIALQGITNLGRFRTEIQNLNINMVSATSGYSKLVGSLMAVIFEAADVASDPEITRRLVALFNLMQGKEYAGQERAWGAIGFVEGHFDEELIQKIDNLQHAQEVCFSTFAEFDALGSSSAWKKFESGQCSLDLIRLRKMITQLSHHEKISNELSEIWYECATKRIDEIQAFEHRLTERLITATERKIEQVSTAFKNQQSMLENMKFDIDSSTQTKSLFLDPSLTGLDIASQTANPSQSSQDSLAVSPQASQRSFYELLKEQSQHIKQMSHELQEAKTALHEQKKIDRAKLLLMQAGGLSEAKAYKQLRSQAMNSGLKLVDLAHQLIENTK